MQDLGQWFFTLTVSQNHLGSLQNAFARPHPRGSDAWYRVVPAFGIFKKLPRMILACSQACEILRGCLPHSPYSCLSTQVLPTPVSLPTGHLFQTSTHSSSLTELFPLTVHNTYKIFHSELSSCSLWTSSLLDQSNFLRGLSICHLVPSLKGWHSCGRIVSTF